MRTGMYYPTRNTVNGHTTYASLTQWLGGGRGGGGGGGGFWRGEGGEGWWGAGEALETVSGPWTL